MKKYFCLPRLQIVLLFAAVLACCLAGCAGKQQSEAGARQEQLQQLQDEWGVEIVAIRYSADGYMLDFRYKVLDSEKAAQLGDRRIKPYLIEEKTGAMLIVPTPAKVGSLRQSSHGMKEGRVYFMLFANPGRRVQPGDLVTVVVGDFRAERLVVQ